MSETVFWQECANSTEVSEFPAGGLKTFRQRLNGAAWASRVSEKYFPPGFKV